MTSRDLLYIYFDVMSKHNITIPEEDIIQRKLFTFDGMLGIIYKQLERHK